MRALILFYFSKEINNATDLAKYWMYIEELMRLQVLPMATNPFVLKNTK